MPGGRPSKYDPQCIEQARTLAQNGATEMEVADFFDINVTTLRRWKAIHAEFGTALKVAGDIADDRVERSLYERANGYSVMAVKHFVIKDEIQTVEYIQHYPPDPTSAIFWLKNRRRNEWRDRRTEEPGEEDVPLQNRPAGV